MKARISEHLKAGHALRDRVFSVRTEPEGDAWKADLVQWETDLYEMVAKIDPADVVLVKYIGVPDRPLWRSDGIRGSTGPADGLPPGHPLKDDPAVDEHNTRICRVLPDYLKTLPRPKPKDLKVLILDEYESMVKDQPLRGERGEKTHINQRIAAKLGCHESRVR